MKKLTINLFFLLIVGLLIKNPSFASQVCGDVCPPASFPGAMDCGNGVVDIEDIMCEVDFALTAVSPDDCQTMRADVPLGTPPNCGLYDTVLQEYTCEPDGFINISDIMVIINMALQKEDCCSFCGEIECLSDQDCDDGNDCTDDTCHDNTCDNRCNAITYDDPCCTDPVCGTYDICGNDAATIIKPEDVLVTGGAVAFEVDLCLDNQNDTVRSVQLDLFEESNGYPADCFTCVGCTVTERTPDFSCVTSVLPDGNCRVLLYTFGTTMIAQDLCSVTKIDYVFDGSCPFTECVTLHPTNTLVIDPGVNQITSAGLAGVVCITDFDRDGVGNGGDNCPATPNGLNRGTCAIGSIGQVCVNDEDCGGGPGSCKMNQEDTDGDGIGNVCDNCPNDPENDVDSDDICGDSDNCPEVANPNQQDADADEVGDACDECTDTDGDTYGNPGFPGNTCLTDNCPDLSNSDQSDYDGDGIGDVCDECTDTDGDGYGNPGFPFNTCLTDNCPDLSNSDQSDYDGDGIGDACDECTDADGDTYGNPGFTVNTCPDDNCSNDYNPGQEDFDEDSMGDVCDPDDDNDTIPDEEDNCPYDPNNDLDADGICWELDNCPSIYNPGQEDTFPPQQNGIGDACDCEGDFNCDRNVAADDVNDFLVDFGRNLGNDPCTNLSACNGDFNCDQNVAADDVNKFLEDFGRNLGNNICPQCVGEDWCVYP